MWKLPDSRTKYSAAARNLKIRPADGRCMSSWTIISHHHPSVEWSLLTGPIEWGDRHETRNGTNQNDDPIPDFHNIILFYYKCTPEK